MRLHIIPKLVPPLAIALVAAPLWYTTARHTSITETAKSAKTVPAGGSITHETVAQNVPVVSQTGSAIRISLDASKYKNVQKVEFYVENRLVGATYAKPYQVSLDVTSVSAIHPTVMARIYTDTDVVQTKPVNLERQTVASAKTIPASAPVASQAPTTAPVQPALSAPQDVSAVSSADAASVNLTWSDVAGAEAYQIWRDGTQIATVFTDTYIDNTVQGSATYTYRVVAINDATMSDPSTSVTVVVTQSVEEPVASKTLSVPVQTEKAAPAVQVENQSPDQ